ncbi:TPA: hypothetical protein ACX6SB_000035 [Photobacterium damselae]
MLINILLGNFESYEVKLESSNKFVPVRVQHYHDYLQRGLPGKVFIKYRRAYIRNICYSLQYMEYLKKTLHEIPYPLVENQLTKTFIITGCSAIESILWMLLKGNNINRKMQWLELQRRETNRFVDEGKEFKFEVAHYRKLDEPADVEMKFVDMCKVAEKSKVLGVNSDVYAKLNRLRKLRNRIHIHAVQHDRDNDFWVFSAEDLALMESVLAAVLKSTIFEPHPNYDNIFYWLDQA